MRLATCPFCRSGDAWNRCGCVAGQYAYRDGLIAARKKYGEEVVPVDGAKNTAVVGESGKEVMPVSTVVARPAAGKRSRPLAKERDVRIVEHLVDPPRSRVIAPLLAAEGECPSCDRRRKLLRAAMTRRRDKKRSAKSD